ncbi:MAG TPA: BadF/BadG/BcrA/BcrD ATPase family protein [Solirubrobacteraceae bacterium]
MTDLVFAVDGGNVKTDLAIVAADGRLLAFVRGGRSSPHYVGIEGCVTVLERLLADAVADAGLDRDQVGAASAQIMVAGADLPEELAALRAQIEALGWASRPVVENDTFALLRSGTDRGWGVAVVCGGGINCVGRAPDGRQARFLSLGPTTGDWGGGYDVGIAALMAAARSADGRGPRTVLESAVPAYFDLADPFEVARALHLRHMSHERLGELARVVYPASEDDPAAAAIVARLADEVIAFSTAAMRRLDLIAEAPDVVLGGGLIRAAPASAIERIELGVCEAAPSARVLVAPTAPIVGAALLGLDEIGVNSAAAARARAELQAAFTEVERDGAVATDGRTVAPRVGEGRRVHG